jgi:hypothetical protein
MTIKLVVLVNDEPRELFPILEVMPTEVSVMAICTRFCATYAYEMVASMENRFSGRNEIEWYLILDRLLDEKPQNTEKYGSYKGDELAGCLITMLGQRCHIAMYSNAHDDIPEGCGIIHKGSPDLSQEVQSFMGDRLCCESSPPAPDYGQLLHQLGGLRLWLLVPADDADSTATKYYEKLKRLKPDFPIMENKLIAVLNVLQTIEGINCVSSDNRETLLHLIAELLGNK